MPTQKTDRDTTWFINSNNRTWTLAKNASIAAESQDGIDENGFLGNMIRVLGDITVSDAFAVRLTGSTSSVLIGKDSRIDATNAASGIVSDGAVANIVNHGHIEAADTSIGGNGAGVVENHGTIDGSVGVYFAGAGSKIHNYGDIQGVASAIFMSGGVASIENAESGQISGDNVGVYLFGGGRSEIVNKGVLRGDTAIKDLHGELTVFNTGKIVGDISLGDSGDIIDTRKGIVKGEIDGGFGGDTYKISDAKIKIIEASDGTGNDEVQSTVSYKLADNVEILQLIGRENVNGAGTDISNYVYGNRGDNHLSGKGGDDFLGGGSGNDLLTGGAGADIFVFSNRTEGIDQVDDFEDGADRICIYGVYDQATFDALDIRQAKGEVIINLGRGNEIRIEDLTKLNFTFEDMIQLA